MVDFRQSSHHDQWFLTQEKLADVIKVKHELCVQKIAKYVNFTKNPVKGDTLYDKAKNFEIKAPQEEKLLATACQKIIQISIEKIKKPNLIIIALTYLQRFYLHEHVFCVDPYELLYACIYLAAKTEELSITADKFCELLKKDPVKLRLVHYEQILLQGLKFQTHIFSPVQSADSLIERLDHFIQTQLSGQVQQLQSKSSREELIKKLRWRVYAVCFDAYCLRKVVFLYSPSVVSLACFQNVLESDSYHQLHKSFSSIKTLLALVCGQQELNCITEEIWQKVAEVNEQLKKFQQNHTDIIEGGQKLHKQIQKVNQKFIEFKASLNDARQNELLDVEPHGFWQQQEAAVVDHSQQIYDKKRTAEQAGLRNPPPEKRLKES